MATRPGRARTPLALLVALVALLAVWLARTAINAVPVYLGHDAAQYISRSRSVVESEPGEVGYLPVVPLVVRVARIAVDDVAAVELTMLGLVVLLAVSFGVFIRGRLKSPIAEACGAAAFALSPMVAEAVGWYGAGTLLGLALLTLALRPLDNALREPSPRNFGIAGALFGAIALTHPFWAVVAAQVVVLAGLSFAVGSVVAPDTFGSLPIRRFTFGLGCAAAAALAALAFVRSFYERLDYSVSLDPSAAGLRLVKDFALRDAPWFGVVLVVGTMGAVAVGKRLNGQVGLRLGVWTACVAAVIVADLVFLQGASDYTTRILYALPLVAGVAVAACVAVLRAVSGRELVGAVGAAALVGLFAWGFDHRLDVAVPYYNTTSDAELRALYFLKNDGGSVLIATRNLVQHDYHRALITAIARRPAPGPLPPPGTPSPEQVERAADVGRLMAGTDILRIGDIELATSPDGAQPVEVALMVGPARRPVALLEGVDARDALSAVAAEGAVLIPARPGNAVRPLAEIGLVDLRNEGGTIAISARGQSPSGATPRRLTQDEIFRRRGITSVLSFTNTELHRSMSRRPCLTPAYANAEVTVWRVDCADA